MNVAHAVVEGTPACYPLQVCDSVCCCAPAQHVTKVICTKSSYVSVMNMLVCKYLRMLSVRTSRTADLRPVSGLRSRQFAGSSRLRYLMLMRLFSRRSQCRPAWVRRKARWQWDPLAAPQTVRAAA